MRCIGKYKHIAQWSMSRPVLMLLLAATLSVLWNEYLSFVFARIMWANLQVSPSDTEALRLLLVADPQLIGVLDSNSYSPLVTNLAIVDSDRYLSNGFTQAYRHVQPDVVIFLGDLFDEGSNSYLNDYINYFFRFQDIFKTDPGVKSVYIWGDNDVGGEAFDPKMKEKMARFEKTFQSDSEPEDKLWALDKVKDVDFIKIDQDFGSPIEDPQIERLEEIAFASNGRYKILLNHMTVFYDVLGVVHTIVHTLKANLIFSAHIHMSKIIKCRKCTEEVIEFSHFPYYNEIILPTPGLVYTFDLNNKSELVEITVPTCSYRNGEMKTGYGAAVLGGDGILQFTVLSLPSRGTHFWLYGILSVITGFVAVIMLCDKCFHIFCIDKVYNAKLPIKLW